VLSSQPVPADGIAVAPTPAAYRLSVDGRDPPMLADESAIAICDGRGLAGHD
jgi:hypothetical protein